MVGGGGGGGSVDIGSARAREHVTWIVPSLMKRLLSAFFF